MNPRTSQRQPTMTAIPALATRGSDELHWLGSDYLPRGARTRTLATGDVLADHRGIQRVILANHGFLTLFPNGSAHLQSSDCVDAVYKDGVSTITFAGLDYVRFDCYGIICVVRGDRIAALRHPLVPPRRNRRTPAWLPGPAEGKVAVN